MSWAADTSSPNTASAVQSTLLHLLLTRGAGLAPLTVWLHHHHRLLMIKKMEQTAALACSRATLPSLPPSLPPSAASREEEEPTLMAAMEKRRRGQRGQAHKQPSWRRPRCLSHPLETPYPSRSGSPRSPPTSR